LLSQPRSNGGLRLGTIGTSALCLAAILGLVTYVATGRGVADTAAADLAPLPVEATAHDRAAA
jgi:uncharacterized membrane-anchored protein